VAGIVGGSMSRRGSYFGSKYLSMDDSKPGERRGGGGDALEEALIVRDAEDMDG